MSMAIKRASYTGDPGLFGDIFRGIGGAVGGLLTGGPLAALRGGIGGFQAGRQPPIPTAGPGSVPIVGMAALGKISGGSGAIATRAREEIAYRRAGGQPRSILFDPLALAPGGAPAFSLGPVQGMAMAPMNGAGYHPNKSDYFLKTGEFVPAGSRMVKNRKRNPANARATSRAISRVTGAKRYAKSLSRISIRKKC